MQRLHGMGEPLYEGVVGPDCPVRVYAPVGTHEDLLAYLVRRLLENGANTSFVHRLVDPAVPEDAVIADPVARLRTSGLAPNPRIPLPARSIPTAATRPGSISPTGPMAPAGAGRDPGRGRGRILALRRGAGARDPRPRGPAAAGRGRARCEPGRDRGGARPRLRAAGANGIARAGRRGRRCSSARRTGSRRTAPTFLYLLAREAGRTLADGIAELREAADFLRYYALGRVRISPPRASCRARPGSGTPGQLGGRGVFAAISPWNFPLSIFVGQVAAALASGNAVGGETGRADAAGGGARDCACCGRRAFPRRHWRYSRAMGPASARR